MTRRWSAASPARIALGLATTILLAAPIAMAGSAPAEFTPTGQSITPTAAKGSIFQPLNPGLPDLPDFVAGQASALALSPDGRTLLILTSGYNRNHGPDGKDIAALSNEYVFVYDVSGAEPVKRQVLTVPDTFLGLAWSPLGKAFYVSGGVDDDVIEYKPGPDGAFAQARTIPLGHHRQGLGLAVKPAVAGIAISPDGRRLLAANIQNDSVSLIDLETGQIVEQDLRPGVIDRKHVGEPGGSFPRAVAWTSRDKAYVASQRDREVIALTIRGRTISIGARIKTIGQPVALTVNLKASRLYAALDNTDGVAVIDPRRDQILERIATAAPKAVFANPKGWGGAGSNALALSPDGRTLLVSNGGENALAVIRLDDPAVGVRTEAPTRRRGDDDDDAPKAAASAVVGLIPTGWYPTAVAVRPDGRRLFVVNGKSPPGADPLACRNSLKIGPGSEASCEAANQYVWQLEKAGFLTLPPPSPAELGRLTRQVAQNDHFPTAGGEADAATFAFLRQHIHHVIYIVKENRTYDQLLGDLEVGDGDPKLAVFGRAITPNQHALARDFVDLDAFYDSGESSNTGWNWTTAGRTNDYTERAAPVNYADRGLQYDQEGANRGVNVGFASAGERTAANPLLAKDPDLLPGAVDVAAPDGPDGESGQGYIWNAALRAGVSVRNWGFYGDLTLYYPQAGAYRTPLEREPWKSGVKVFVPAKAALMGISDPYFRGFDQAFPDYWRFKEWEREFDGFAASGTAPQLMLLRLPHDHTGSFSEAIDGVDTVEAELADNDYAVGLVVDKVAKSRFASDTLIFVIEDDAQDGPDHVDAHRSVAFIAGPYVKHAAVVSRRYTTVNLVRTIEDVLGLEPMGLNDALAEPMGAVFDLSQPNWSFDAQVPGVLRTTKLPLPPAATAEAGCAQAPRRDRQWWTKAMAGQDFTVEDHLDTTAFNRTLWRGLKGDGAAYPTARDGRDLRRDRAKLLKASAGGGLCG